MKEQIKQVLNSKGIIHVHFTDGERSNYRVFNSVATAYHFALKVSKTLTVTIK